MKTSFMELDKNLKKALLVQLRNLWTHTSTAIEGNTLTLGETAFVLTEGLTISGKPLKDHEGYLELLARYHLARGRIQAADEIAGQPDELRPFHRFCESCWSKTMTLVDEIREKQRERNQRA